MPRNLNRSLFRIRNVENLRVSKDIPSAKEKLLRELFSSNLPRNSSSFNAIPAKNLLPSILFFRQRFFRDTNSTTYATAILRVKYRVRAGQISRLHAQGTHLGAPVAHGARNRRVEHN